jgi:16S rRNA pseudouridine516 synthase
MGIREDDGLASEPVRRYASAMVRVERLLANRGYCARAHAAGFLRRHVVLVADRRVERVAERVEPSQVTIDGEPIDPESLLILLNKPVGSVCAHRDEAGGKLVYDLLPDRWRGRDPPVSTVGRLDKETSGVLLLTDDGALLHRLTSPKRHLPRVYLAELRERLRGDEAERFASGTMRLPDDDKPLLPASLEPAGERSARVTLREGRYHQVRRMFAAVGNHVVALRRERFGPLTADGLAEGSWRLLTGPEAAGLTPDRPG